MKRLGLLLMAGSVIPLIVALAEPNPVKDAGKAVGDAAKTTAKAATDTANKMVGKADYKKVPAGKTYTVLDAKGKTIRQFKAGEKTTLTTDCVQVPCPKTFADDVVCWKCKERIKANE